MKLRKSVTQRILSAGAIIAAAGLALGACAGGTTTETDAASGSDEGSSETSRTIEIGAMYLDSQGFYGGVRAGVQRAADESGVEVRIVESTSAGDVAKESSFMNSLIAADVDAIILSAVSVDGSVAAVKQAHDAGIPVICYNTCVNDEAMEQYVTAYILGDPEEFGRITGEYDGNFFKDKGIEEPEFAVVNCEQFEVCQRRQVGFEEALNEVLPGATIVANQQGTEADEAITVAEQMLTANPGINGLYGQSGGATVGTFRSVMARELTGDVFAFGSDMTTDIATALADGTVLQAIADISGIEVGILAFEAADAAISGEELSEKIIPAPITLYTPADAEEWLETHPDGLP